tara:strand:+ start:241 stop:471 length:231 start_codon:yes stop_codon:yes gene_type:complete
MNKTKELTSWNTKLSNKNFVMKLKIEKLEKRLIWIDDISVIWRHKDKIKELKHKMLINEQQVRFNLMTMLSGRVNN